MPKIIHFRENCIGCNSCVEHAPGYWNIDKDGDGKSDLIGAEDKDGIFVKKITDYEIDCNRCAAIDCPVGIIRIQSDQGKDITKHD